ncbi:helix-turn-helix domain-containing protein [Plantibacter sp. VKM Ac-2880]|uniref:helix-turn-helix domain-containing protein n=1 Tax=Plantibacter sp. VKM Ac-2880 TaxID=2783827 RepID=UPI00188F7F21|nr:helix-turn-helix domain-containing protein [Plantibacter sp. VKM Ac-2880]
MREVASLLSVDPRTVSAAARAGDLPCVRIGRLVLIPREPLLALLAHDAAPLVSSPTPANR